jgi:hypothetical protein
MNTKPRYFWLAVLPLSVFLGSEIMLSAWSSKLMGLTPGEHSDQLQIPGATSCYLAEATGKIYVIATVLMVVGLSIASVVVFLRQLGGSFLPLEWRNARPIIVAFSVYTLIGILLIFSTELGITSSGRNPLPSALQIYGEIWITSVAKMLPGGQGNLLLLQRLLMVTNLSLIVAISAIVVGTICCLFYDGEQHSAFKWKEQLSRAQSWLYIAAALLACGLLYHRSWGSWLGSCLEAKAAGDGYNRLVSAFAAYRAIQYSAFLAAFYVPVLYVLRGQARWIALGGRAPTPEDDVHEAMSKMELNVPAIEMFKTFCGILTPFAVGLLGPIGEVLKAVGK